MTARVREDGPFATRGDDDLVGGDVVDIVFALELADNGGEQFRRAKGGGIVGIPGQNGLVSGINNVLRRVEVGFAARQIDNGMTRRS